MNPGGQARSFDESEGRPGDRAALRIGHVLDECCYALVAAGIARVHVDYADTGPERVRSGPPRYEPADADVPEGVSCLAVGIADRLAEPPQPDRHVFMIRDEIVTIDPGRRPRAQVYREGTMARVVDCSGLDDPELQELLDALRAQGAEGAKALFNHFEDGHATIKSVEITPADTDVTNDLLRRLETWASRRVEREPLDLPMFSAGGFVLFEVGRNAGALHHRTRRMFPTNRSID